MENHENFQVVPIDIHVVDSLTLANIPEMFFLLLL